MAEGVATIVFTDVEGSTALAKAVGDERARELIERQREVVREALAEQGGREIDTAGDGFMLAFESVRRALLFARTVQDGLAERGEGIRVRIGAHAGEVLERDGHPFGNAVNGAARIAARARGGHVLVSATVRELAGEVPGLRLRDRGKARLKGFDEPWRLYELDWEGRREMPPLVAKARRRPPVWFYAASALVAVAAGLGAWFAWPSGARSVAVEPSSVAAVDPSSGRVVAVVPTGAQPSQVVADGDSVWVASVQDQTLTLVDARARRAVWTKALPIAPYGLAAAVGSAWVSDLADYVEVDPDAGPQALQSWPSEKRPRGFGTLDRLALAVHDGELWRGSVFELGHVPLAGGKATVVTRQLDGNPEEMVFSNGVWVLDGIGLLDNFSSVFGKRQVSFSTNCCIRNAGGLVAQNGTLWIGNTAGHTLVTISPSESLVPTSFPLGATPEGLVAAKGVLWSADDDGNIAEFDPKAERVVRRIHVGGSLSGIAYADGLLWATVQSP